MIETLNLDNRDSTAECLEGLNLVGFIIFMQKDYGVLIRNVYWGGYHAVNLKTADRHMGLCASTIPYVLYTSLSDLRYPKKGLKNSEKN